MVFGDDGAAFFQRVYKVNIVNQARGDTATNIYDHMSEHIRFNDDPHSQIGRHMIIGIAQGW